MDNKPKWVTHHFLYLRITILWKLNCLIRFYNEESKKPVTTEKNIYNYQKVFDDILTRKSYSRFIGDTRSKKVL